MATIAQGTTTTVFCPLDSTITVTPGTGGKVSINGRGRDGSQTLAPRELYASATFNVYAGDTVSMQAIGVDATYTDPALSAAETAALQYRLSDVVDPRDWTGFSLDGEHDNSTILQAAIDASDYGTDALLGYAISKRLVLPPGRIAFSSPLYVKQNSWIEGVFGADGGTMLRWYGADGEDALINTAGTELSFCHLSNFRLQDYRTNPTSGRGISFKDFNNGVSLRRLQVMQFPLEQIYIGADSGQAGDCTEIYDVWVNSTKDTSKGILLERLDNQVIVNYIRSDILTAPANDGYVIRCQNFTGDNTAIEIANVKHESNNRCPTLSFPRTTRGNLSIRGVVQRNPQGGAAGAGDVIQVGASSAGSAYDYAWGGTITTGSGSEGGARMTVENIFGFNHADWTGASGAATIRCLGTSQTVFGHVGRAQLGASGRITRDIGGSSQPNGAIYGNVGDRFSRLDATSSTCSSWIKQVGSSTNTGWAPLTPETQAVAYAASISVNLQTGNRVTVGALTGAVTHNSPTNMSPQGVVVQYDFTQDGTGGRGITWSALHKGAWPTASGTASQKKTVTGISDGTNVIFSSDSGWY